MKRTLHRCWLVVALVIMFVPSAPAQDSLSVSYQYFNYSVSGLGNHMPLGIAVDYSRHVGGAWSLVGSFDWSRDTETYPFRSSPFQPVSEVHETLDLTTYAAGARWTGGGNGIFFQLMGGLTRTASAVDQNGRDADESSASDFMLQPGAGFNLPFTDRWSATGQVDVRTIFSSGNDESGVRLAGGLRLTF